MTDSQLANDRTFLAWLRTGITLFGLGFVVAKVAFIVESGHGLVAEPTLYSSVGIVIVLCGAAVVLVGFRQHAAFERQLQLEDRGVERWAGWTMAFAVSASIGAIVLSALIIVTT
jgi:putative membrane protein